MYVCTYVCMYVCIYACMCISLLPVVPYNHRAFSMLFLLYSSCRMTLKRCVISFHLRSRLMVASSRLTLTPKISSTLIRSAIRPRSSKEYGACSWVAKLLTDSCCSQWSRKDLTFFLDAVKLYMVPACLPTNIYTSLVLVLVLVLVLIPPDKLIVQQ